MRLSLHLNGRFYLDNKLIETKLLGVIFLGEDTVDGKKYFHLNYNGKLVTMYISKMGLYPPNLKEGAELVLTRVFIGPSRKQWAVPMAA